MRGTERAKTPGSLRDTLTLNYIITCYVTCNVFVTICRWWKQDLNTDPQLAGTTHILLCYFPTGKFDVELYIVARWKRCMHGHEQIIRGAWADIP